MARRPLSLSAYLALARGRDRLAHQVDDWPQRPKQAVVWLHADTVTRLEVLQTIAQRLRTHGADFALIVTCDAIADAEPNEDALFASPPPAETVSDVARFVEHWTPDVLVWAGNGLRPALLEMAAARGAHMLLVDAADAAWRQPSKRWLPDATASALGLFHTILAQSEKSAQRLRRLGIPRARIEVTSPLQPEVMPLYSHDGLHEEMSSALTGRPVWLAACIHVDEAQTVIHAHRRAARLAHRLMVIVVPQSPEDEGRMTQMAHDADLRVARWDHGEMPDENTQVLIARDDGELGLWYRLAPLSFLGGSLVNTSEAHSPLMAAALGSAILYGPNVGKHLETYSRLVAAGAARIVKDTDSLSAAVTHLIAPDRAAAMAHAGWNVVSAGAETSDLILTQLEDWLDAAAGAA